MPAPALSWWQKLLKAIGLYKEPVRPPRPERRPDSVKTEKTQDPRRTKTRDARSENRESSPDSSESAPRNNKRRDRDRNENDGRPRGGDASSVESRRVYVGNLSFETSESDLEELFKGVGAVRRVEIIYNRATHRSKGYGFIEMLDIDEAKRCVEVLHDQFFMGRKLTVSGAKSKEHETAEGEESAPSTNTMPQLAPLNPVKEEVTSLIEETPADEPQEAPAIAEVIETPTQEIETSPEPSETPEEVKS